jgi:hypothetical protein
MNWLRLGRGKATATPAKAAVDAASCMHTALAPRWDRAQDIGRDELASSFRCDACQATFTREEAEALREREAQRLRELLNS